MGVITVLSTELLQLSIPVVEFESKKCFRCIFVNRKLREEVCCCINLACLNTCLFVCCLQLCVSCVSVLPRET